MGLKAYFGFSLLLILVIGVAVFIIEPGYYELKVFDSSINLPILTWILLPVVVLFVLSLLHLLFYGSINYYKIRAFAKDEETLINIIKSLLLQKEEKSKPKTREFKNISKILKQLNLDVKDSTFTSKNDDLNQAVSLIKDINSGKFIAEKSLKLDSNSELAKQNLINKIKEQPDFALDILKKVESYSEDVIRTAFIIVLNEKSMTTVKKVYSNIKLDRELAFKLFLKDVDNIDFGLTKEEVLKITKSLNYSKKEYIVLAKMYKEVLTPDKIIELFEKLSEEDEEAVNAYLYILCELEMIDKVREIIDGYDKNELVAFRALLDLKEAGKQYSLDDISYNY